MWPLCSVDELAKLAASFAQVRGQFSKVSSIQCVIEFPMHTALENDAPSMAAAILIAPLSSSREDYCLKLLDLRLLIKAANFSRETQSRCHNDNGATCTVMMPCSRL